MRNKVKDGLEIVITALAPVVGGQTFKQGSSIGVVGASAAIGEDFVLHLQGEYELVKKTSEGWTQGMKVYWDPGASAWTNVLSTNNDVGAVSTGLVAGSVLVAKIALPGITIL